MRTAFIGLGVMGYPMARHLKDHGHDVVVYNRTEARSDAWVREHGGALAHSPAEAAKGAELVLTCVGADDDVRSVAYGDDGLLATLSEGAIWVDHTTASAELAREMDARCAFVDAPVSGGQAGAENGTLTVMCGASDEHFARVDPVLACYGKRRVRVGEVGAGQLAKMVNQICIAGLVQGLSEGVHFAEVAGLDHEKVFEAISAGAAGSWQMSNRADTMHARKFDFGFALDWMRKDLGLALTEARRNGARLPVAALVDQYYGQLQAHGSGRLDHEKVFEAISAGAAGSWQMSPVSSSLRQSKT
ncbi:MAG: NAD(P)-dependent oxidoreductase, partial [Myxococcota bacterium]